MDFSLFSDPLQTPILKLPSWASPEPDPSQKNKPTFSHQNQKEMWEGKKYMETVYFLPGEVHVDTQKVLFTPGGCSYASPAALRW